MVTLTNAVREFFNKIVFQISAVRTGVRANMGATLLIFRFRGSNDLSWSHRLRLREVKLVQVFIFLVSSRSYIQAAMIMS